MGRAGSGAPPPWARMAWVGLVRLLAVCGLRSRCPCCKEGRLFAGPVAFHPSCPVCGLRFEQWVGDWVTPTYLAASLGIVAALGTVGALWWMGIPLDTTSTTLPSLVVACAVALAALRPCKALWLGFLYWVGGVEVSAETLAHLRWSGDVVHDERARQALRAAEERARSVGRREAVEPLLVVRRFTSLREVLLPRGYRVARPGPPPPGTPAGSPPRSRGPQEPGRR